MSKVIGSDGHAVVAVASGKGGTGKTTISVALALTASASTAHRPTVLLDCDVEEPNAGIFLAARLRTASVKETVVDVPIPVVDESRCTGCGACARMCRFNAIIAIKKTVMVFPDLCHSCGGCALVCPVGAIREVPGRIGLLSEREVAGFRFIEGALDVGKAMSPPLIRAVKRRAHEGATPSDRGAPAALTVIDAPPGTSCPMMTAVRGVDAVLLVTEPTPFGLHDLKLAVAAIRTTALPFAVIVNRCDIGDNRVEAYCAAEGIPLATSIPDDRRIAAAYSRGETLVSVDPKYRRLIEDLHRWLADFIAQARRS